MMEESEITKLEELEKKFDEVCDWLTSNSLTHTEFDNKMKEFKELDEQIMELL